MILLKISLIFSPALSYTSSKFSQKTAAGSQVVKM